MRHLFGWTIPYFHWSNKIPEELELDFLVIVNTAKELAYSGDVVNFYFVVMNNSIPNDFRMLIEKYQHKVSFDYRFVSPDYSDFKAKMDILGNLASESAGRFVISDKLAKENRTLMTKYAKAVGRRTLYRTIKRNEDTIHQIKKKHLHPSGLEWDYYGIEEG